MTPKKYTEKEALEKAKDWEVAWFTVEAKDDGTHILNIDFCCHFRLPDGKYFQGQVILTGSKDQKVEFVKRFAETVKTHWASIFDKSLADSVEELN